MVWFNWNVGAAVAAMVLVFTPWLLAENGEDRPAGNCPVSMGASRAQMQNVLGEADSVAGWTDGAKVFFYKGDQWQGRIKVKDGKVVDIKQSVNEKATAEGKLDKLFVPASAPSKGKRQSGERTSTKEKEGGSSNAEIVEEAEESGQKKMAAKIIEDFSGDLKWASVSWPNANDCELEKVTGEEKNALLSLTSTQGENHKAGMVRKYEKSQDLSGYERITLDVKVSGDAPLPIALGFWTGKYYETSRKTVTPGWNRRTAFDLTGGNFKSADVDWEFKSPLKNPEKTRRIYVLVYTANKRELLIDNLKALPKSE